MLDMKNVSITYAVKYLILNECFILLAKGITVKQSI